MAFSGKTSPGFLIVNAGTFKKNELLAEQLGKQQSRVLLSSTGLDPVRNIVSREGIYSTEVARIFSGYENTFFHTVPFEVKNNQTLFRFLGIERHLYDFVLNYRAGAPAPDSAYRQSDVGGTINFYSLRIPEDVQSYDEIVSWMESIPSAIICFDGGIRCSVYDPVTKIMLEESPPGDKRFAFLGDSNTIKDESVLMDMVSQPGSDPGIFITDDMASVWTEYHSATSLRNKYSPLPGYGCWLQYLESLENQQKNFQNPFSKLELQIPAQTGNIPDLHDFLHSSIKDFSSFNSSEGSFEARKQDGLKNVISLLIRMGFGEASLLSSMKDFSGSDRAVLSLVRYLISTGYNSSFIFRAFFSGLPISNQKKILEELKSGTGVHLIFDDAHSISDDIVSESEVLEISFCSDQVFNKKIQPSCMKKLALSMVSSGKVYLLPNSVSLDEEGKDHLFSQLEGSGVVSSLLYFDLLYDTRKNNWFSTFGTFSGILHLVRELFARHPLSLIKGFTSQHYSYLSKDGRCPVCSGFGITGDTSVNMAQCYYCRGGRLDPERYTVMIDGYSFYDIHMAPLSELSSFFHDRLMLRNFYRACEDLDLLDLSLGTPVHSLYFSEYKKIFLIKLIKRFQRVSQCVVIDGMFRGLTSGEAEKKIFFIEKCCKEGALVILRDTAKYLERKLARIIHDIPTASGD